MRKDIIWNEKYRPNTLEDCILPDRIKKTLLAIRDKKEFQHLLFSGSRGVGKTTTAKSLANDTNSSVHFVNSSLYGNIDLIRNDIKRFASTVSITGGRKLVILDEADHMTPQAQAALRAFMEQYSKTCSFILTCNYKNKIIPELSDSRCSTIEFDIGPKDFKEIGPTILQRMCYILDEEKIEYNKKTLLSFIASRYPDIRKMINDLQKFSLTGPINSGILVNNNEEIVKDIVNGIKSKDYNALRKSVFANGCTFDQYARTLYDIRDTWMKDTSSNFCEFIEIYREFQYQNAFVADKQMHFLAMLLMIMKVVQIK